MSQEIATEYEAVIGLEVHAQLNTKSKLFAGDDASFGSEPNTHVSAITLGHPGTLPMMNKEAIVHAIKMGLVCNSSISQYNYFARKNYFYPDLPKGYQISQHTTPICVGGYVSITASSVNRDIRLTRIHLEEDAGKSIHDQHDAFTLLDYNRAGVPLIEIVSEPDMHSAEEAAAYLTKIRKLVRWIGICDGNMEEGSLRCDANISVRPKGEKKLGIRVEVKNLNSIRHLKHAVEIEIKRLINMEQNGEKITQETRSYDADKGVTFSIRTKEDAEDYRYFPEPDLAPFSFTNEFIEEVKQCLPQMPETRTAKYISEHGLSTYDAEQLTEERTLSDLYDRLAEQTEYRKQLANFLLGPVRSHVNATQSEWAELKINAEHWSRLLQMVADGKLSFSMAAQKILPVMIADEQADPVEIAMKMDLIQDAGEGEVDQWINDVILSMPEKVEEYRKGKKGLIGLFVGEVKRVSKGKADPKITTARLNEILNQKP